MDSRVFPIRSHHKMANNPKAMLLSFRAMLLKSRYKSLAPSSQATCWEPTRVPSAGRKNALDQTVRLFGAEKKEWLLSRLATSTSESL